MNYFIFIISIIFSYHCNVFGNDDYDKFVSNGRKEISDMNKAYDEKINDIQAEYYNTVKESEIFEKIDDNYDIYDSNSHKTINNLTKEQKKDIIEKNIIEIERERLEIITETPAKKFILPLNNVKISSDYGIRINPIKKYIQNHKGVDYVAVIGTPFYATNDGIIEFIGYNKYSGNWIKIKHGKYIITKYLHANDIRVNVGDTVKQGDIIGTVGKSGMTTGPHLHYEILINNKNINPNNINYSMMSDDKK
ncbi:MAG: M23 family metallopeptidase [Rickettsiales bacterium]|jgi:murein DD-endopeptidase MepM/ murein hydrolase activator NlpD|nr:M23 family metallopeptidase [Rickettsiales bacterium]